MSKLYQQETKFTCNVKVPSSILSHNRCYRLHYGLQFFFLTEETLETRVARLSLFQSFSGLLSHWLSICLFGITLLVIYVFLKYQFLLYRKEHNRLPFQAIECYLSGVKSTGDILPPLLLSVKLVWMGQ